MLDVHAPHTYSEIISCAISVPSLLYFVFGCPLRVNCVRVFAGPQPHRGPNQDSGGGGRRSAEQQNRQLDQPQRLDRRSHLAQPPHPVQGA